MIKSTDSGATWEKLNIGVTTDAVYTLAIDPDTPSTLYAGTSRSGVLKSTNGGANWSAVNTGMTTTDVRAFAIDPATPSTLYAGIGYHGGVFKSTDGGGSWSAQNTGLPPDSVNALAIDPATPSTLYAGGWGTGVFKSTDGGGFWEALNTGMTNSQVFALAIDPAVPSTLYAATYGVYKSTDSGATWSPLNTGLPPAYPVYALAIDPAAPSTIYAGVDSRVFKSTNGGEDWTATELNFGRTNNEVGALAIDPAAHYTIYAGTWRGVYKSTHGGQNWTALNSDPYIFALAIDPTAHNTIYAGTGYGVIKSTDGGKNWNTVNTGLTNACITALGIGPVTSNYGKGIMFDLPESVYALAIDPVTPSTLYAGNYRCGVFKSTNGGENWTALNFGLTNTEVSALAIDPANPTILYTGTYGGVFAIQQKPALLAINYSSGAPGSTFNIIGSNFPSNSTASITINGNILGTISTDSVGGFVFYLKTNPTTEEGFYQIISVSGNTSSMIQFSLTAADEVHPQAGSGTVFVVPDGIAYHDILYLPLIKK